MDVNWPCEVPSIVTVSFQVKYAFDFFSLNPAVDIGQIEGAFMMGVGFWLSEKMVYDETTGELLTDGTWEYKPPASQVWNTEKNKIWDLYFEVLTKNYISYSLGDSSYGTVF